MKVQNIFVLSFVWMLNNGRVNSKELQKRQIYREEVSPHLGGKIPDTAFLTDRLALNRLQSDGVAVPDGLNLEQRNPRVYQYTAKSIRPVYKVMLKSDNRYTPPEGKYKVQPSIETTYLLHQPLYHNVMFDPKQHTIQPIVRPLLIPNPLLKGHPRIQAIKSSQQYVETIPQIIYKTSNSYNKIPPTITNNELPSFDYNFGQDYSTLLQLHPSWNYLHNDYITSNILNDFETFFNSYSTFSPSTHHI